MSINLTGQQHRMLLALLDGPCSAATLADHLYGGVDNWPEWAVMTVRVQVHRVRAKGVPVVCPRGRYSMGYMIPPEARAMVVALVGGKSATAKDNHNAERAA